MSKWYVYLACFDRPIGTEASHARHYVGMTDDVSSREAVHRSGNGARILRSLVQDYGGDFRIVRTWEFGSREEAWRKERKLKKASLQTRYCPDHGRDYLDRHRRNEAERRERRRQERYGDLIREIVAASTEEEAYRVMVQIRGGNVPRGSRRAGAHN